MLESNGWQGAFEIYWIENLLKIKFIEIVSFERECGSTKKWKVPKKEPGTKHGRQNDSLLQGTAAETLTQGGR